MSTKLDRVGAFLAYPVNTGITKSRDNGYPQFKVQFDVASEFDYESKEWVNVTDVEESEIRGSFCLAGKDEKILLSVKQVGDAFNWKSGSLAELNSTDYSDHPVLIIVKEDNYGCKEGETRLVVDHIANVDTDPASIGGIEKLDDSEVAQFDLVYQAKMKAELGGEKPKTVGAKPKRKPVAKKKPAETATNSAAKDAAAAKVAEKKIRAENAEAKSQPPGKAAARPVIPKKRTKPPSTTLAPELTAEEQAETEAIEVPASCTQEQAWELCEANGGDDAAKVEAAWVEAVDALGGDGAVGSDADGWGNVAQIVVAQLQG